MESGEPVPAFGQFTRSSMCALSPEGPPPACPTRAASPVFRGTARHRNPARDCPGSRRLPLRDPPARRMAHHYGSSRAIPPGIRYLARRPARTIRAETLAARPAWTADSSARPGPPAAGQPASRAFSSFEPQACPPQEDFVARPQPFAAPVPRRNLDGPSVTQHARAELASLVADAVFARIQADVRVPPRHRGVGFVAALFEDHVVAPHHTMLGI